MRNQNVLPERKPWKIEIDLCRDFNLMMQTRLIEMGYQVHDPKHAAVEYFKVIRLQISQKKRNVYVADTFQCPAGYEKALSEFRERVEKGRDLTPFMTEKRKDANFNDLLFNDWNIHHFHLTRRFRPDGMAQRSDYELFAYFTEDEAYFLQTYPHKKAHVYASQELVRTLDRNWPHLLEGSRLNDIVSLYPSAPTDAEYDTLRKAHMLTMLQVAPGNVIFPLGGGYASDGTSIHAVRSADHWHNFLKRVEIEILQKHEELIQLFASLSDDDTLCCLAFRLILISDEMLLLRELRSNLILMFDLKHGRPAYICPANHIFGMAGGKGPCCEHTLELLTMKNNFR